MRIGRYDIRFWPLFWRLLILAVIILWITSFFVEDQPAPDQNPIANPTSFPEVLPATTSAPNISTLLVQLADTGERRMLSCNAGVCQAVDPPDSLEPDDTLFDGTWWYHYAGDALVRTHAQNGEQEIIKAKTALVQPREAVISPDGTKLAYWLDNIDGEEGLTEVWVYDTLEGGSGVVAEKLVKEDVVTRLRWNRAGTNLIFLADNSGDDEEEKIEPVVIQVEPLSAKVKFATLEAADLTEEFQQGVLDINNSGTALAIARPVTSGTTELIVIHENAPPTPKILSGTVVYTSWLPDGSLIYAIQAGSEFTFYKAQGSEHVPVAKGRGEFHSGQTLQNGTDIVFVAASNTLTAYNLSVTSGSVTTLGPIPAFGQYTYIVNTTLLKQTANTAMPPVTAELTDGQITAFIEKHAAEILEDKSAAPIRIIMTDQVNTAYIDYQRVGQPVERILVIVKDAINPEWKVLGRYQSVGGEWKRAAGEIAQDPAPVRLYEWEEAQTQWILKETY